MINVLLIFFYVWSGNSFIFSERYSFMQFSRGFVNIGHSSIG